VMLFMKALVLMVKFLMFQISRLTLKDREISRSTGRKYLSMMGQK
jgi:hypothetical protein